MTTLQNKPTMSRIIAYWIATGLLAFGMLSGAIAQLLHLKWNTDGIIHLGYPVYVLNILGAWKVLGVLVLLIPGFTLLKEWAYSGFFFLMTGAIISHLVSGDGFTNVIAQTIFVLLIILSWYLRPANRRVR